jgi:alkanesulfonate monooxygenase SsuD/methylene tetrahydromethanopterin reductase-like flavin-dependent oxidoreductase (luciferase family)
MSNQPVQFGVFLSPKRENYAHLRTLVATAESTGFDFVSIQDHPYVPHYLDTFVLIANLIGLTDRVRFFTNVANLPLRPPAMLAKASATLDYISGGRFELGLGGGRNWPEIVSLDGPERTPGEVVSSVDEAITVLRAMWSGADVVDVTGKEYSLISANPGPTPAHSIGIWLGAAGPRMLTLIGEKADGWIAPMGTNYETKPASQARIDEAARSAGREPGDIRRVIQLVGVVNDDARTTQRPRTGSGGQSIVTTPEVWGQIIAEFVEGERFDTVNFIPAEESVEQLTRFAREVIPAAQMRLGR